MTTPPSGLITALRAGTVARHLFFYLNHPSGAIRAWDGIGEFQYGGNTYLGVGGLAEVGDVGNSIDIQNHSPYVKLNRVQLTSLKTNTTNVRGAAAAIYVGYIQEDGTLAYSRTLFSGVGDVLITKITETEAQLTLKLRGPIADWALAPRAYYTPEDQKALYPSVTDTGLDRVRSLENMNISGWRSTVDTNAGDISRINMCLFDTANQRVVHCLTRGGFVTFDSGSLWRLATGNKTGLKLKESATTADNSPSISILKFGGNPAYVDPTTGYGLTPGNSQIYPDTLTVSQRVQITTAISANGAAGVNTCDRVSSQYTNTLGRTFNLFKSSAGTCALATPNTSGAIVNNCRGYLMEYSGAFYDDVTEDSNGTAVSYVEDVTNTAVTISGAGRLQVGGVNCTISANGVVLSSGGRRIKRSGSSSTTDFLRIFT